MTGLSNVYDDLRYVVLRIYSCSWNFFKSIFIVSLTKKASSIVHLNRLRKGSSLKINSNGGDFVHEKALKCVGNSNSTARRI